MMSRRVPRGLASAVAVALVLSACGGSDKKDGPAGGEPVRGGTLVRAINYGDPRNLDPILATDVAPEIVVRNLFSRLLRYDPATKEFVGDLATEWTETADHMTWTFTLRKGAKFTNGREITAADVKYSLERLADPKNASPASGVLVDVVGAEEFQAGKAAGIAGITVDGDSKVTVAFRIPVPTFSLTMAQASTSIVPKEEVEKAGDQFGRKPVGSGPFVLESWKPDDRLVLKANKSYHGGRPYLDGVVFRIMKDEATRDADFRSGALDMMTLAEDTYQQYKADATYSKSILEVPELFTRAVFFNTTVKPFDDVRVRQAVNYAVNKKPIVQKVLANKAFVATGPLQASSSGFDKELEGYGYNPERAKALLEEAGLGGGFEMEVIASSSGAKLMEALISDLGKVGITLKIMQVEAPQPIARSGSFKTAYYSTGGDVDPVSFLYARFHTKSIGPPGNVTRYSNPQVDQLLDKGNAAKDPEERARLAKEAQRIIVKDAPWFFFNYNKAAIVHKPEVHGLQAVPTDIDYQDLTKVWLEKAE